MSKPPVTLTIAGSDSSGGAGIQADIKAFERFGTFGTSAITLLTAQNTQGVQSIEYLDPRFVRAQIDSVVTDFTVAGTKTGALGNAGIIEAVTTAVREYALAPLVVDPVMISKHGHSLVDEDAATALVELLIPLATLITPNTHEAAQLAGDTIHDVDDMERVAKALHTRSGGAVLITGGSLTGTHAVDVLATEAGVERMVVPMISSRSVHGTGCTFSAAITSLLALGVPLRDSVETAKDYLAMTIAEAPGIGHGVGPLWHQAGRD